MKIIISTFFVLALLQAPNLTRGEDFGYDGDAGPTHWGERYRECTGKHQSPININVLRVKQVTLPDIEFVGFDDSIDDVHVTNNGHTGLRIIQDLSIGTSGRYREFTGKHQSPININVLQVKQVTLPDIEFVGFDDSIDDVHVTNNGYTVLIEVENEPHPRVRGGPLEGDYVFSQMHFHWGDNDTFGSEDKINHRSFPMELHMVFFKEEYQTAKEAVQHSDGLTVLAFFYELDRHQHPAYDDITSALANVTEPHTSVVMSNPFSFLNILPYDLRRYFTYRGSLTTPPCSEVVTWLDFEQPVRLAHEQIEVFRELKSAHGKIRHNFRPIQPIGDRTVFYNIDNNYFSYNELDDPSEETTTVRPSKSKRRKGHNSASHTNLYVGLMLLSSISVMVVL